MLDISIIIDISQFTETKEGFNNILLLLESYNNIYKIDNFEEMRNNILYKRIEKLFDNKLVDTFKKNYGYYDIARWLNSKECEYMLSININTDNLDNHFIHCMQYNHTVGIRHLLNMNYDMMNNIRHAKLVDMFLIIFKMYLILSVWFFVPHKL